MLNEFDLPRLFSFFPRSLILDLIRVMFMCRSHDIAEGRSSYCSAKCVEVHHEQQ